MKTSLLVRLVGLVALLVIFCGLLLAATPELLPMRSGIAKTWKQAFYLSEDHLRRIQKELEIAAADLKVRTKVIFHVIREDHRFYETTKIEDVLSDPNVESRRIDYVRVELRISEPDKVRDPIEPVNYVQVEFERNGSIKAALKVRHEDRTWALVTADRLEAQIQRVFHKKYTPAWIVLAFALSMYALGYRLKPAAAKHTLSDFLHQAVYNPLVFGMMLGVLLAANDAITASQLYVTLFGPESGFLWGESQSALLERQRIRDSIFWVVMVGLPLTIVGNLLTGYVLKPKSPSATAERTPNAT